jgi:diacylglycerol kinase
MMDDPTADRLGAEPETRRPRRSWAAKFAVAFRGLKLGVRGHSSFSVHFFFAALVLVAATVLQCDLAEWCLLIACIGGVLTAELFNSAIETLFRALDPETRERAWPALDISAGAVLLASLTASAIGLVIFLSRLVGCLSR